MQSGCRKRFEAWEKTKKQLDKRYWQLRERMGLAEEYQADTTIAMYPTKAEQLAERILNGNLRNLDENVPKSQQKRDITARWSVRPNRVFTVKTNKVSVLQCQC